MKDLKEQIEELGVSDLGFGGKFKGGWHIQQDTSELAQLVECLANNDCLAHTYLGIGTASGGTERFIVQQLGTIEKYYMIDDGQHPDFKPIWQGQNKPAMIESGIEVIECICNSHDEQADEFLKKQNVKFDIIGIDGDHTSCGTKLDWMLVEPYIQKGTLVWLHDTNVRRVRDQGPLELFEYLSGKYEVLLDIKEVFGIGVVRI